MLEETVLGYLVRANRPYSCKYLKMMLRHVYTQQEIQQALDMLATCGRVQCKIDEQQQVVYFPAMHQRADVHDDVIEAMIDFDARARSYKSSTRNENIALRVTRDSLMTIKAGPPTESACAELAVLDDLMSSQVDKMERMMNNMHNITTKKLKQILPLL